MQTTPTAVAPASPFASWKFEHAAIRVPDFEAAVTWYTETLDFRLIERVALGEKVYGFLSAPGDDVGLTFELIAGPGADNRLPYEDLGSSLKMSGLHHVGFRVGSVDDTIQELKRRGATIVSEPHDVPKLGLRLAFFADPWGNLFEVIQAIGR
jgi:catechol 2,3-dioxygenase-like lactoylglutathione lyase family enzyme